MPTDITPYIRAVGGVALPENAQWRNRFKIRSESSTREYTIAQRKSDGSWACACAGWKRWRNCKHLTNLATTLRQIAAAS